MDSYIKKETIDKDIADEIIKNWEHIDFPHTYDVFYDKQKVFKGFYDPEEEKRWADKHRHKYEILTNHPRTGLVVAEKKKRKMTSIEKVEYIAEHYSTHEDYEKNLQSIVREKYGKIYMRKWRHSDNPHLYGYPFHEDYYYDPFMITGARDRMEKEENDKFDKEWKEMKDGQCWMD